MNIIPSARPDLEGNEAQYVLDTIRSSWISSTGPYIARFEKEFAELCGTQSCITVSNGTAALHLALLTLNVRPGDEVIVPSLTFIATANAVRYVGAEPVFVDVDPGTWCIDPEEIEQSITSRTKGVIAVHLYGHPADMDRINVVAKKYGLWVIEDAAEAVGASYKRRPTGCLASMATFSFYGNKVLTSGEGGAVTTSDPELESRARLLRGQGMDPQRRYYFPITGYNFRLTNVACAILCAQLERRNQMVNRRHAIYALYHKMLADISGIRFQPIAPWATISPWLFCITVTPREFGFSRDELIDHLSQNRIETRPFFIPVHTLPPFCDNSRARGEHLPVTVDLAAKGLTLPTSSAMSDEEVHHVCRQIAQIQNIAS